MNAVVDTTPISENLLARFDVAGPRYTSYPTADRFVEAFTADDYAQALSIANEHIAFAGAHYVAAEIGGAVIVFADTNGDPSDGADAAVMLLGRTLADISLQNFSGI